MPNRKLIAASGESTTYSGVDTLCLTKDDTYKAYYVFGYQQFPITYNTDSEITLSNEQETINSNESFSSTITLSDKHALDTDNCSITINGSPVELSTVIANNVITIDSEKITGPIIITLKSKEVTGYEVDLSTVSESTGDYYYSIDNGANWTEITSSVSTIIVQQIKFKIKCTITSAGGYISLTSTKLDMALYSEWDSTDYSESDNYMLTENIYDIKSNAHWCFDAGTKVTMSDYSAKNIEDVAVGDSVLSYNEDTKEFIAQIVTNTFINQNSTDLVYLNFENGAKLGMTAGHPLLTVTGWKSLKPREDTQLLEVGDSLITQSGTVKLTSIEYRSEEAGHLTYNLDIEVIDNFLVEGFVAHNRDCEG